MNPRPPIDLNAIVQTVHANQRGEGRGWPQPADTIHMDRNGLLIQGKNLGSTHPETLLIVQPDVFHAGWEEAERRIAQTKMPTNTRMVVTHEGIRGWLYSFQTEFLDTYKMFSYFDGSFYQVLVIEPFVEHKFRNPHTGHLYGDGRICMGMGMNSGRRTLAEAYAKSVLWATGFSAMIYGNLDRFPFNHND